VLILSGCDLLAQNPYVAVVRLEEKKEYWTPEEPKSARVDIDKREFAEYWFNNEKELRKFVAQMPKWKPETSDETSPMPEYLLMKKHSMGMFKVTRVKFNKAPVPSKMPNGVLIGVYSEDSGFVYDY
ncbi:MAG: hypothetical protein MN733_38800, partial [Nitrososphaera sp.]|nr:hypothetical protein [Nitrososphaera sp.]